MNNFHAFNKFKILIFSGLFLGLCLFSYGQSSLKTSKTDKFSKSKTGNFSPSKFMISAQVGYGYRIAPTPNTNDFTMFNKIKLHLSFGADFSYFFTNYIGVGIKYNAVVSHAVINNIIYSLSGGATKYNYLSELSHIHYFAPLIATQFFTVPRKQCLFASAGAGYVLYSHKRKEIANITKHSAAFLAELGYDFFVNKYFAMGLQTSLFVELTKRRWSDVENLTHIDISLRFRSSNW